MILFLLYTIAIVCILGFVFSLTNRFFGWSIGFKGTPVPADLRASAMFWASPLFPAVLYTFGTERSEIALKTAAGKVTTEKAAGLNNKAHKTT